MIRNGFVSALEALLSAETVRDLLRILQCRGASHE